MATVDLISQDEPVVDLPELTVNSDQKKALHILAYVREYSLMTTYSDTIKMYREKWIDYMIPSLKTKGFTGWKIPRVLSSKSYYHFTDTARLDSVSDRINHHFSWSDWIEMVNGIKVPSSMKAIIYGSDTIKGKHSPLEIWRKEDDRIFLKTDAILDTAFTRNLPNFSRYLKSDIDFDRVELEYSFLDVGFDELYAGDLLKITCNIESRSRGRNMFRFNKIDQPFFVSTHADIYIADREYIPLKEAKGWEKFRFEDLDFTQLDLPSEVPELDENTLELISRVEGIEHLDRILKIKPDRNLIGRELKRQSKSDGLLKRLRALRQSVWTRSPKIKYKKVKSR